MPADPKETAPYAPVHNVLTVVRRLRDRGLPNPLDLKGLERTGVPEGNTSRTLVSLKFLGLITDDGFLTPAFERLGKATTEQYPEILAEVVRAAYAPVFTLVNPSEDAETAIQDAFRHYKPPAQRNRMVTLFLGLCREAGMIPGGPPTRKAKMRRNVSQPTAQKPIRTGDATIVAESAGARTAAVTAEFIAHGEGPDLGLLSKIIQQLPRDGKWTKARRDTWIQAVTSAVDLLTEVTDGEVRPG